MKKEFVVILLLIFITLPLIVLAKDKSIDLSVRYGDSSEETFLINLNEKFNPDSIDLDFDIGSKIKKFTKIVKVSDNEYNIIIKPESGFDESDLKEHIKIKIKDNDNSQELKLKLDVDVLPAQETINPQVELSFNIVLFILATGIILFIFLRTHKRSRKQFKRLLKHPKKLFKKLGF